MTTQHTDDIRYNIVVDMVANYIARSLIQTVADSKSTICASADEIVLQYITKQTFLDDIAAALPTIIQSVAEERRSASRVTIA